MYLKCIFTLEHFILHYDYYYLHIKIDQNFNYSVIFYFNYFSVLQVYTNNLEFELCCLLVHKIIDMDMPLMIIAKGTNIN